MGLFKNLIFIYFYGFSEPPLLHFSVWIYCACSWKRCCFEFEYTLI